MSPYIAMTYRPPGRALAMLEAVGEVWQWEGDVPIPRHLLLERSARAAGLFSMLTDAVDEELLAAAPDLRVVSNMAVGVDNVDLAACTSRGIPVGHTPDVLTATTADTAFGLLLMAARRLVEGAKYVQEGSWRSWDPGLLLGQDVHGSTLGIVGLGRIGRAIAHRARGFEMVVLYSARHRNPAAEAETSARFVDLGELLSAADHVVVAVPLTDETYHLIDEKALALMKPTATLVNISRGATVDPVALHDALRDGGIAAAGLDVTEPEPIPRDSPLLGLDNCVIIPHLGSSSLGTRAQMAELAARNLVAGLAGDRLPACANPAVYD
jgi:lactate dehydrogenase-like 2-hydroxyacid dehydrogenase